MVLPIRPNDRSKELRTTRPVRSCARSRNQLPATRFSNSLRIAILAAFIIENLFSSFSANGYEMGADPSRAGSSSISSSGSSKTSRFLGSCYHSLCLSISENGNLSLRASARQKSLLGAPPQDPRPLLGWGGESGVTDSARNSGAWHDGEDGRAVRPLRNRRLAGRSREHR